jgi:cytochrome c oxidase assembly protein subunit 15
MTLDQFKTIYWWEWTHRFLGRLVGVAFLLPFLWFLWRGFIGAGLRARLWGIFALGAVQGAVGRWMVASGLADRVSVSQYRLAFHLTLACVIYAAILWVAVGLGSERAGSATRSSPRKRGPSPASFINAGSPLARGRAEKRLSRSGLGLLALVLLQIYLGALVAGLDAGLIYNTWPLIDGSFIPAPDRLFFLTPTWRNFFENELTVQFVHRMLAYTIFALALVHALDTWRTLRQGRAVATAFLLALAVTLQATLGIVTLLWQAPIGLALAHQAMAVIVLTVAVLHAQPLATWNKATGDVSTVVLEPAERR